MITITCDNCGNQLKDDPVDHKTWAEKTLCEDCYNKVITRSTKDEEKFEFEQYNKRIKERIKK